MIRRARVLAACFAVAMAVPMSAQASLRAHGQTPARTDRVAEARRLAQSGRTTEALQLLDLQLTASPGDTDARTLRGTVLSWRGRYPEARADLEMVLARIPDHADAVAALANLELWDGHPDRSEALAARGLTRQPANLDLLETRARALEALGRLTESRNEIEEVLRRDASRESARRLRRSLVDRLPAWFASAGYRYDRFSEDRDSWHEAQVSLSRQFSIGSLGVRAYGARRFGLTDDQIEVEAYPRFWNGTTFYLAAAVAPDPVIYPRKRFAADVYQSLGAGWEVSVGGRALYFSDKAQVHTAALAKYVGNWMHTARAWVTPHAGTSTVTVDLSTRRYRAAGESYWGLRYARGNYREDLRQADFERLHSHTGTFELNQRVGRTYVLGFAAVSREDRAGSRAFWQTSAGLTFRVRF